MSTTDPFRRYAKVAMSAARYAKTNQNMQGLLELCRRASMPELISSKLQRPSTPIPGSTLKTVLIAVVVVAALYFGRDVLVPIALAVLLTFVLAPLVRLLQGCYFPRIIAVVIVGLVAFAAILGSGH